MRLRRPDPAAGSSLSTSAWPGASSIPTACCGAGRRTGRRYLKVGDRLKLSMHSRDGRTDKVPQQHTIVDADQS
jgi:hypothetical protein